MSGQQTGTAKKIIDATEKRMRDSGFHGASFRDVAADVGIKSASVHHHFPTKEDLGAAVVRDYTERFMAALGAPDDTDRGPTELMAQYVDLFRQALIRDETMCLCGIIASEINSLPEEVVNAGREFFQQNLSWLDVVLKRQSPRTPPRKRRIEALRVLALLEGAMLVAKGTNDLDAFELIAADIGK